MPYNSIHQKGQLILLIVYANMAYDFYFILFILGFIFWLGLNLSHKQFSHKDLIMKHPKKNEFYVISQRRCFSTSNRSRVIYIFSSKTSLYNDFGIHHVTIDKNLDNLKFKMYDYFIFSTKILEGSDLDNLLSLNELIKLKDRINPKKPSRSNPVILKDRVQNIEKNFYSLRQAARRRLRRQAAPPGGGAAFYIEDVEGVCDIWTLRKHMKKNTLYKNRWEVIKA